MAPKKKQRADEDAVTDAATAAQEAQQKESERLKELALDSGILSDEVGRVTSQLPLSKALVKANGKDITKKSSTRRNRYLVVVNALLAPAAAGRLGTLAQLDSRNPVMYIDCPGGRLKLFGTLAFPRAKFLALKLGGAGVAAEDVFENLLVFSEAWWIGTAEENPEEKRLPLPPHMQPGGDGDGAADGADGGAGGAGDGEAAAAGSRPQRHTGYDFAYGAGPKPGEPGGPPRPVAAPAGAAAAAAAGGGGGGKDFAIPMTQETDGGARPEVAPWCVSLAAPPGTLTACGCEATFPLP
ncbi:hypothetical protein GPECTOR_22g922 [Gonium pectorale]|uniref:Uncharacterized protein n=1 Tax=Gonium pectorale TaxID=33097 RepID=A0A150GHK8_GONPE|nr:hypothetical protein GPECTOR_22g922 [Gonium pectorale]|eukprot:KXZ49328.1 hypothetical protein GPECTOR_22g922 [Gonium pectorale]